MPPKAAAPAAKKAAKSSKRDDDDALLEQAIAAAEVEKKARDKQEAVKAAKEAEAAAKKAIEDQKAAKVYSAITIYVDDVAKIIVDRARELPHSAGLKDMCWLAYVIHNFLALCVERKCPLKMRVPSGAEEAVVSIEVFDDVTGGSHSWNMITTEGGATYVIDVTLEQFLPSGRLGYRRDADPAEGWMPLAKSSRLVDGSGADLVGVLCKDAGILPQDGTVVVALGVPAGTYNGYIKFLQDSCHGRFRNMTPDEKKIGTLVQKRRGEIQLWFAIHEKLIDFFFAPAIAALAAQAAGGAPAAAAAVAE